MSQAFHRLGEKRRFVFAESSCIAAVCWDPCVMIDQSTKKEHGCCRTRALSGCPPENTRHHSVKHAERRSTQDGWRLDTNG